MRGGGYTGAHAEDGWLAPPGTQGRLPIRGLARKRITDPAKLARIEALVIPPAWRDVWISPRANAKLQAVGVDAAGRRQYLYHPEYRARQEQAKYDRLVLFAERLPALREAMSEHMEHDLLDREHVSAVALRLVDLGWLRVGGERYAKESRTFGVTTLQKRHVTVRGKRVKLSLPGQARRAGPHQRRRRGARGLGARASSR